MRKTKLTRSLLAACSIVALSVALSGCLHSSDDDDEMDTGGMEMPMDTDGDGVADDEDAFPNDPNESADSDDDGVGDNADAFPNDDTETMDSDGDGVGDNADAFPMDAAESMDSDMDGVGDNADAFPMDATETMDSDGDGVGDNAQEAMALDAAQMAADAAADAAEDAADAAEMAANGQMANQAADAASYAVAQNAAMRARTAATAARTASDAAAAAMDSAAAQAEQAKAEAAQTTAETEQANAEMYAGMVADAQQAIDDENQRMMDVASARMAAMQSYMDADADATMAEAAADEAEATAPGSPGAMAARDAATAARNAANAAKMAHDAIMDGMTKAQADAEAEKAANQAMYANSSYMTAKAENDDIQTAAAIGEEQIRVRDVMAAMDAAEDAAMAARTAATAARMAATSARMAADAANDAYMMAMAARTDSDAAEKAYMDADAAATAAEMAAMAAEMAATAAEAAHMGIDSAGSGAAAQAAQMTAETRQGEAETQRDIAMARYDSDEEDAMGAMQLAAMAEEAAGTHVLRLFLAANGAHVMDDEATMDVDETAAHVTSVGAAMAAIAAIADGVQAGGTTASATFPGDTVEDPDTDGDQFMAGNLTISVNPGGGGAIPFELRESRAATDLNNDGDITDDGEAEINQTAMKIADLGAFQGYELWEDLGPGDDTNADRARAIVFTNKQQGDDSVLARIGGGARSVNAQAVTAEQLSNVSGTGNTITGVTWTPTDEPPLMGTLSCTAATCSITLGEDGAVTTITGYTFTGSRAAVEAVTAEAATDSNEYLIFGLWLDEGAGGADTFGAFADGGVVGGTDYAVGVQNAVTGTATYTGHAAGAHHKTGEGVNWFHGDARLTANFGAIDTDAERGTTPPADTTPGTISGEISNIRVNGGDPMSDSIELRQAALTDGTATFNGMARMGDAMVTADDMVEYPYNGTWSGSFYGATADDAETTDVNESVTAPLAAAGTFGVTRSEGMGDDMVVESFVGAFGAHLDD